MKELTEAATAVEISKVCAWLWLSKSVNRWEDEISSLVNHTKRIPSDGKGRQTTQEHHFKKKCFWNTEFVWMMVFIWSHGDRIKFFINDSQWLKGRIDIQSMAWGGWITTVNNFTKPERALLKWGPSTTVKRVHFLSINIYCCSAKFPTSDVKSN